MQNFQTVTIVVPAGAVGVTIPIAGKWVELISCTAASVGLGFNQSVPQVAYPGRGYPGPQGGFQSVKLLDTSGAGCTVVLTISEQPMAGQGAATLLTMAAYLQLLIPATGAVLIPRTTIAQLGVGGATQILAANASRKWFMLETGLGNAGNVYLGFTNAVDAVNSFFEGMAGATCRETFTGAIWARSDNGTETVNGYELT